MCDASYGMDFGAFSSPYPRKPNKSQKPERPCAGRWLTSRGHSIVHHYRRLLDRLEVDDAKWSAYDDKRAVRPFQIICTYSRWLMCRKEMVYHHLPERVKRPFGYILDIPRHLSDVPEIPAEMVATVFKDPRLWCYTDWGERCERVWHHEPGLVCQSLSPSDYPNG
ncbi:hypothetical protein MtrunA17_Chr4g0020021 [Medicago truncatula]|uniref:Aminotransferase-like plant mobile domain-containing protein n=1 Tax=Medicago truncatula TaxID=3880 RepID=A0A396I6U0_MEDTR|nr:hypothetical protein MtrunA17_Chr4g0020021 [Medicago truncatula]